MRPRNKFLSSRRRDGRERYLQTSANNEFVGELNSRFNYNLLIDKFSVARRITTVPRKCDNVKIHCSFSLIFVCVIRIRLDIIIIIL